MSLPPRWASGFCKRALFVLVILIAGVSCHAMTSDTVVKRKGRPVRIYGDVVWMMGLHSTDFFKDYQSLLGGGASTFDVPIGLTFGISSFQLGDLAIGVTGSYYRATVRETYTYDPRFRDSAVGPEQTLTQAIVMNVIPIFLTADYFPIQRQFTGYVGAGVGMGAVGMTWEESVANTPQGGSRPSGVRYDETHYTPAFLVRAGVSLGWDKRSTTRIGAALYFEVSYSVLPFSADMFQQFSQYVPALSQAAARSYRFQAGGIGIHGGVSIFLR